MKLSHKIGKLAQPLTYRRAWRRAQRSIFPLPVKPLLASIDQERLREIQQRYARSSAEYAKYADVDRWLRINRNHVQDLKLHRSPPKHVLDLGCGGGFFLFILKSLGHSVLGLDLDQFPLFTELLHLFDVERVVWRIKALEPLPDLDQKFDWITAFSINFNLHYPEERLGASRMGFLSARFAATSRPGRQNLFRTQPHVRRWLLYARAARSFSKEGRRGRARTNFFRERITLLAYAAVARRDARTNVLARFLCRR